MNCPRCKSITLVWDDDYDCDDLGCTCGDGIVSYYHCPRCNAQVEITLDCKGEKEEEK